MSEIALTQPLFGEARMIRAFDDRARVQGMLDFEAALALAQARSGLFPLQLAVVIGVACDAGRYDLNALAAGAAGDGNVAIGLVKALIREVAAHDDPVSGEASMQVHRGATSQDAIDTGCVLQMRAGLVLIEHELDAAIAALARLARTHRNDVMPGRTWLQQAVPISFGLKAAGWLDGLLYARTRLRELRPHVLALQFGGAAGSLSALGRDGICVAQHLADELGLQLPPMPWHGQRGRIVETGAWLGLLIGSMGKIGRDLALLMQSEVGEAFEPAAPGRGGSSAMPHKRNPVACAVAIAAATRAPGLVSTLYAAMPQEHERGLGGWLAEWDTLPELFRLAAGSLAQLRPVLERLEVDAATMRAHCVDGLGLLYAEAVATALSAQLGRADAHARVQEACRRAVQARRPLREVLCDDEALQRWFGAEGLNALFDPDACLGANDALIDRVLARLD